MFCVNGQCGSGTQELYTSDAGDAGRDMEEKTDGKNDFIVRNWTTHDIDGDGIADIATRDSFPGGWAPAPAPIHGAPVDAYHLPATLAAPGIITTPIAAPIAAPTYAAPIDNTPCAGQVGLTGYNTQYVDCPTSRPVTETIKVPRTVVTNRQETRTRTRYVPKTVSTPVTKYRTETRLVPQQRTVPYTDIQYNTVNQPVTENYTVNIPQTRTYTEKKYRTRYVSGTKKCPVKVPVYGASCGANNSALIRGSTGALVNVTGIPTSGAATGWTDTAGAAATGWTPVV